MLQDLNQTKQGEIMRGLLHAVDADGARSQRHIAAELGIALGLVNSYLKRCVRKGWIKVNQAPARRCAYYLTPQGFAEKSRLTVHYLSTSFSFYRQAKSDCGDVFEAVKKRGFKRVVLAGKSDLAEIAILCSAESEIEIVAIVDARASDKKFVGIPLVKKYADVTAPYNMVIVTDVLAARSALRAASSAVGDDRVLAPALLGLRRPSGEAP